MKILLVAAALFGLATLPATAQEAQCFQNEQYLVIAKERVGDVGTEFIVRPPAQGKIACTFDTQDGDIRVGEVSDPIYFAGLAGQYLVLQRFTSPDGNLVIYDLADGAFEPIIDIPASDELDINDTEINYWERTDQGTAENCAEFAEHQSYGFGSVIEEQRRFDVATGAIDSTGEWRCANVQ